MLNRMDDMQVHHLSLKGYVTKQISKLSVEKVELLQEGLVSNLEMKKRPIVNSTMGRFVCLFT